MQKIILIFAVLFSTIGAFAQTGNDKILGKWTNEDKTRVIEFVKSGSVYEAVIRKADDKSLIGKKQITGLKPGKKTTTFTGGTVHLFKKETTATCTATLSGSNKLILRATASGMSKSQTWTRI